MTLNRVKTASLLASAVILLANACTNEAPVEPTGPDIGRTMVTEFTFTPVDSLARLFAIALADPSFRTGVRDHLRDSPFQFHSLELKSYLSGKDGATLSARMAQLGGRSPSTFAAAIAQLPPLEITLRGPVDRLFWKATPNVVVSGTELPPPNLSDVVQSRRIAFNTQGTPLVMPLAPDPAQPLILIQRITQTFPPDAEVRRAAAPKQARLTISTSDEERLRLLELGRQEVLLSRLANTGLQIRSEIICDPRGEYCYDDDPPPEPVQGGVDLDEGIDLEHCFGYSVSLNGSNDQDQDGLLDSCEFPIAYALRPVLNIGNNDQNPTREPYWTVARHPSKANTLQIFYAIAYHEDTGAQDWFGYSSHQGDSEFIIFEATNPVGTRWRLDFATLSAHWGEGGSTDHTATYAAEDLEYTIIYRARPRIWVSIGKHANYRKNSVCDSMWNDGCGGSYLASNTDIRQNENLGNYFSVTGGTRLLLSNTTSRYGRPGTENFWLDPYFGGWSGSHAPSTATAYPVMFQAFGF